MSSVALTGERQDVPRMLIRALFQHPEALQVALHDAGLAPHDLALWARQTGLAPEVEKLAGWLSVGQQPGRYKPLLEVAGSHLRSGDWQEALPVFRWAYRDWLAASGCSPAYYEDGTKLLAQWGACLHRLGHAQEARAKWLLSLDAVLDEHALARVFKVIEATGDEPAHQFVLDEALRRGLPGAEALCERQKRLAAARQEAGPSQPATDALPEAEIERDDLGVAVMADVANLDIVCGDQYGFGNRPDYGRLLREARRHGPVHVKVAFVPDVPETLNSRQQLAQAGFAVDLKRPKRSHGRLVANADTAMAAAAVRWASDARIGRVELWTGDGDFMKVREAIAEAWPHVTVAFRSFEIGTAMAIRQLGADWEPIGVHCLQRVNGREGVVQEEGDLSWDIRREA